MAQYDSNAAIDEQKTEDESTQLFQAYIHDSVETLREVLKSSSHASPQTRLVSGVFETPEHIVVNPEFRELVSKFDLTVYVYEMGVIHVFSCLKTNGLAIWLLTDPYYVGDIPENEFLTTDQRSL